MFAADAGCGLRPNGQAFLWNRPLAHIAQPVCTGFQLVQRVFNFFKKCDLLHTQAQAAVSFRQVGPIVEGGRVLRRARLIGSRNGLLESPLLCQQHCSKALRPGTGFVISYHGLCTDKMILWMPLR